MNGWANRKGWLARVGVYLAKLVLFLAVPGLHLIQTGQKKAGVLILSTWNVGALVIIVTPYEPSWHYGLIWKSSYILLLLSYSMSLVFIVANLKFIHKSQFNISHYALPVILSLIVSAMLISGSNQHAYHIEFSDEYCPEICSGNLVIYQKMAGQTSSPSPISAGDLVIYRTGKRNIVLKILGSPGQTICYYKGRAFVRDDQNEIPCIGSVYLRNNVYFTQNVDTFYYTSYYERTSHLLKGYIRKSDIVGTSTLSLTALPEVLLYFGLIIGLFK